MTEVAVRPPSNLEFLRQLEEAGALTPTSLDLGGHDVSFDTYEALAAFLGSVGRSHCWWVGDLINWGEAVFGEIAAQAVEALGLSPGTCVNYAYTCRQVARSRRRPQLSFAHHRLVAPLPPEIQKEWLDAALEQGWTRAEMDREIMGARPPEPALPPVDVQPGALEVAAAAPAAETGDKVMEVVRAVVDFSGELGHAGRCWRGGEVDCACGLDRLEAAVAALGVEW